MGDNMSDDKTKVTKTIEHPLEDFLDIPRGSTEVQVFEREGELITSDGYDGKDAEIEKQFQEVYDSAMDGYDSLAAELPKTEGKYKARIGEVGVQHLNAALNAASSKARLKEHKDKLESKIKNPSSVTNHNTLFVDDRSALIDELRKSMELTKQTLHDNEDE